MYFPQIIYFKSFSCRTPENWTEKAHNFQKPTTSSWGFVGQPQNFNFPKFQSLMDSASSTELSQTQEKVLF